MRDKEALGIFKKPNIFMNKMSIHSFFDSRKAFEILTDVFTGKYRLSQYYCAGSIHNVLKHFH